MASTMLDIDLKNQVGLFLIVSQFGLVFLTFILYLLGGYNFDEMSTCIALIVPMVSVYATAFVKYFISNKSVVSRKNIKHTVTWQYAFISFAIPVSFIMFIGLIIILKPFQFFGSFENFKGVLLMAESVFGAYIGLIMNSLIET